MFQNRNSSEFTERKGATVAPNPHFPYLICRPDSEMTETLKTSCPTPNINHLPDYADKSVIANYLIIEDVSETQDTSTPEMNTNHLPDQFTDESAIARDLIVEDL